MNNVWVFVQLYKKTSYFIENGRIPKSNQHLCCRVISQSPFLFND